MPWDQRSSSFWFWYCYKQYNQAPINTPQMQWLSRTLSTVKRAGLAWDQYFKIFLTVQIRVIRLGMHEMRSLMEECLQVQECLSFHWIQLSLRSHISGQEIWPWQLKTFVVVLGGENKKDCLKILCLLLQSIGSSYTITFLVEGCT